MYQELADHMGARYALKVQQFNEIKDQKQSGSKIPSNELAGFFITLAPGHEVNNSIGLMSEYAKRVARLTGILDYYYVYEQKGETPTTMGNHPHLHMLVSRNHQNPSGERSRLKKQLQSIAKTVFKTEKYNNNIREVRRSHIQRFIDYMNGNKKKKPISQEEKTTNSMWRMQNGLKEYYSNINADLCDEDSLSEEDVSEETI